MIIEFKLKDFHNTSFGSSFDQAGKVRRIQGVHCVGFDAREPEDCRQFLRCFERNEIVIDGHTVKDLSKFYPAFGEPECKKIITDLAAARKSLPALVEESDTRAAESAVMQAALNENTDQSRVEPLFQEMRRKQDAAELLKAKVSTLKRRIGELENMLREALSAYRKREADKLKAQLAPIVERFNGKIEEAYAEFVPIARGLLPEIAGLERGFAPEVYFLNPGVPDEAGRKLKTLRSWPRVTLQQNRLMFSLKDFEK